MAARTTTTKKTAGARQLVSIRDAAAYLGVTTRTVRAYIAEQRLPAWRVNARVIRIDMADLDALLTPVTGGAA